MYRESKLTRLLGRGFSGAEGEAVSMVVTVNPALRYASETKHVLSLAAIAQDIRESLCILETIGNDHIYSEYIKLHTYYCFC